MEFFDSQLIGPIVGAIVAGGIIGGEREYRASPAGLRTHMLVSLSCCLLMLSAVHQMVWLANTPSDVIRIDPVRMAHGILTGIGFLCGGAIFREGLNVRGLTTAASLWSTATLGILFGIGLYPLAIFGTIATVAVLAAIAVTEKWAPQRRVVHIAVTFRRDASIALDDFERLLSDHGLKCTAVEQGMEADRRSFAAIADGYDEQCAQTLTTHLSRDPQVLGFDIRPQER